MADKVVPILLQTLKPIKIIKWKVNEGNSVSIGCVFLLYEVDEDDKHVVCKLKSTQAGTVHKLLAQEGDVVKPGVQLLEIQACAHPTVMRDMCAECGADLRKDDAVTVASVPMVHSVPELKVSLEQAQKIGKADVDRLLKDRKLVLLVDLDQTLIHTTNDNIPANIKDVYHFQLYGPQSPWYHTRLRPGTHRFLENMSPFFELHICTFGARNYAHMIAMFLDQDGKLFSQRILSRDECFNPTSKTANLKALFPCGDDMVCIIDDREDVWSHAANLIHVKPYHFFQHTGDINAPPGLDKHESDEKEGVDLSKVKCDKQKKVKANGLLDKESKTAENNVTENETEENNDSENKNDENNDTENKIEENSDTENTIRKNNVTKSKTDENNDTEETNNVEHKIIEQTNNTAEKIIEESNSIAEKMIEESNNTEDKMIEGPNNSEQKVIEDTNNTEAKIIEETKNIEEKIIEETNTEQKMVEETKNSEKRIIEKTTINTEEKMIVETNTEEKMVEENKNSVERMTEKSTINTEEKMIVETSTEENMVEENKNSEERTIEKSTINTEEKMIIETNIEEKMVEENKNTEERMIEKTTINTEEKMIVDTDNTEEKVIEETNKEEKIIEETNNTEENMIEKTNNTEQNMIEETNITEEKMIEETNNTKENMIEETNNTEQNMIEETNITEEKMIEETNNTKENMIEETNNTEENTIEETNNTVTKIIEKSSNTEDKMIKETNNIEDKVIEETNNIKDKVIEEVNCEKKNNKDEANKDVSEESKVDSNNKENEVVEESGYKNKETTKRKEDNHENVEKVINNIENKIDANNTEEENNVQNNFKSYSNKEKDNESKEDELIEIEDPDDYLLYLEDILKVIHKTFYEKYDKLEAGKVPDLKKVIPEVRRNILKDTRLVFSGLVPTHIKLEQSKAYQVARSLGATVTQDLEETTTHLVAVRPGTAKVNAGRRKKNLRIVTPDWLWSCAERWTKVDEKLYTLNNKGSKNRHPPPHCSSPEHIANFEDFQDIPLRKRTPSGRFMDTINPLMSFSSADIADMDREVEDIFNESESEGESSKKPADADEVILQKLKKDKESEDESSSSDESLTGEHPHGWRPNENSLKRSREDQDLDDESTADEFPSTKFRRGEELSSDLDIGQESNSEGSVDAPDEIDDGDWNMMGAALEREFLANN